MVSSSSSSRTRKLFWLISEGRNKETILWWMLFWIQGISDSFITTTLKLQVIAENPLGLSLEKWADLFMAHEHAWAWCDVIVPPTIAPHPWVAQPHLPTSRIAPFGSDPTAGGAKACGFSALCPAATSACCTCLPPHHHPPYASGSGLYQQAAALCLVWLPKRSSTPC